MEPNFVSVDTARIQVIAVVLSALLIGIIIELIRRGKLREEYSIIWLVASLVFAYFSIWRSHMDALAHRLGIAYGPALLILVIVFSGSTLLIHFSIVVSRLTGENKRLAQQLALLGHRLEEIDARSSAVDK